MRAGRGSALAAGGDGEPHHAPARSGRDRALSRPLRVTGASERRRLPVRGARHPAVRGVRRRLFRHSRPADHSAASLPALRRRDRVTAANAFVVGWPVAHSRSPLIHRFWLQRYGLAGDYRREAVPPEEADAFFRSFAERGYLGGNVTIPHKEAAFSACRELTPVARRLGAANTLWLESSALCGDNT